MSTKHGTSRSSFMGLMVMVGLTILAWLVVLLIARLVWQLIGSLL